MFVPVSEDALAELIVVTFVGARNVGKDRDVHDA
jgi:hypothetical protein